MTGENRDGDDQRTGAIMQVAESLAADEVYDGYTFIGAASSGAFRFKWVAREVEEGRFVVHETVGAGTVAVSSQPIPREEVLPYIDERRQRIQRRIDDVKRELASVAVVLPPAPLKAADWPRPVDPPPPVEISEEPESSDAIADETSGDVASVPASEAEPFESAPSAAGLAPAEGAEAADVAKAEKSASPTAKTERDPEEIFEEIRRMLQETL